MEKKEKVIKVRLATLIFALMVLLVSSGIVWTVTKIRQYKRDLVALNQSYEHEKDVGRMYKIHVDGLEEQVVETKALVVESQRALREAEQYAERLKELNLRKVNTIAQLELAIAMMEDSLQVYKSDVFPIVDTVFIEVADVGGVPMIELPASFGNETPEYMTWAVIDEYGLGTTGFEIKKLPLNIVVGSRGFLNQKFVASVSSPMPQVTINSQDVVVAQPKTRVWPYGVVGGASFLLGILVGGL